MQGECVGGGKHARSLVEGVEGPTTNKTRTFALFTGALVEMADWFAVEGVIEIAEATGPYWCRGVRQPTSISIKTLPEPFQIDRTLTPETAGQRGYALVCDTLPRFIEENREMIAALLADGCVLGRGSDSTYDDTVGIYQPLARQPAEDDLRGACPSSASVGMSKK